MTKSTFDIVDIIYQVLSADASITGEITGIVCKKRLVNSDKEDVVIGSLPVSNEQVQQAVANINIHVPNLIIKANGMQDISQPNLKRLNELTALVWGIVDEKYYSEYWFYVQQQNLFEDPGTNEHYSNIRVNFNSLKTSN